MSEQCDRQSDMQCANSIFNNADKKLAEIYQQVADTQEEEGVKRLALAQRNWFKFRDSNAEFVAAREIDPQQAQLQLINQRIDSTLARMQELTKLTKIKNP
ncbi:MAG TPA: lysozyme inhibitor LprI family protein [Spongiibacteraceae bacterium]